MCVCVCESLKDRDFSVSLRLYFSRTGLGFKFDKLFIIYIKRKPPTPRIHRLELDSNSVVIEVNNTNIVVLK